MNIKIFLGTIFLLTISNTNVFGQEIVYDPANAATLQSINTTGAKKLNEMLIQTTKMTEEIIHMKETVLNTAKTKEALGEMIKEAKTAYNNFFGLVGNLKTLHEEIIKTPDDIEKFFAEFQDMMDCAVDDLSQYQRAEMMYEARYVYKGRDNGTEEKWDDLYQGKYGLSSGVDSFEALNQDPCGFNISTHAQLKRKADMEKQVIMDALKQNTMKKEAVEKEKAAFEALIAKAENTQNEKETLDTSKQILMQILIFTKAIEKNTRNLVVAEYGDRHELTLKRLQNATYINKEQYEQDKAQGIKYSSNQNLNKFVKDVKVFYNETPPGGSTPFWFSKEN